MFVLQLLIAILLYLQAGYLTKTIFTSSSASTALEYHLPHSHKLMNAW